MLLLLCFVFRLYDFVEAVALASFNRPSICRRPDSHTCFFFLETSLFTSIFCTISAFSLYVEYVVRSFLPNGVFLPCDHGLDF